MEPTAGVKIQGRIFEHAFELLLFVIVMTPLIHILRKSTGAYKLTKWPENIYQQMYMDNINLFAKNEKVLGSLMITRRIFTQDTGMEFGIEKHVTLILEMNRSNRSAKSRNNHNARKKENLQLLENIGREHHQLR